MAFLFLSFYPFLSFSSLDDNVLLFLQVVQCSLVTDPHTKESRGFGFVTMETPEDADRCIKYLNRTVLEGRLVTVEKVCFGGILLIVNLSLIPFTPHRIF